MFGEKLKIVIKVSKLILMKVWFEYNLSENKVSLEARYKRENEDIVFFCGMKKYFIYLLLCLLSRLVIGNLKIVLLIFGSFVISDFRVW